MNKDMTMNLFEFQVFKVEMYKLPHKLDQFTRDDKNLTAEVLSYLWLHIA